MRSTTLVSTLILALTSTAATALGQSPAPEGEGAASKTPPAETVPAVDVAVPAPVADAPVAAPPAPGSQTKAIETPAEQDTYAEIQSSAEPVSTAPKKTLFFGVLWDMGMPVGSTAKWVNGYSVQGFSVDIRYYGFGNFGLGGSFGWNTFSQKTVESLEWEDATLTGTQVRELSSSPLTFKAFYAVRNKELAVIPYGSFGLGGSRSLRRLDLGITRVIREDWQFLIAPELGVEIPAGSFGSALASVRLNYMFKTESAPEQAYLNFSLGFGFD